MLASPTGSQAVAASPAGSESSVATSLAASTPGRSRRPVCFSLHKYFRAAGSQGSVASPPAGSQPLVASPELLPYEARQAEPQPSPSWKRKAEQDVAALQSSVDQLCEQKPEQAVVVQAVPVVTSRKQKGGRPKKAAGAPKSVYRKLTGQQTVWAIKRVQELLQVPGASRKKVFQTVAAHPDLRVSPESVQSRWRSKDFWLDWGEKQDLPGCSKAGNWRKRGQTMSRDRKGSAARGCRQTGSRNYLGRTDHCRGIVLQLSMWVEAQEAQGHELHRSDLLRQYCLYLDDAIASLRDLEQAGCLSEQQLKTLNHMLLKQTRMTQTVPRKKQAVFLLGKTGMVERRKQRVTALTPQEEQVLMESGWKFWDYILQTISQGNPQELAAFVAQPERFVLNKAETVISMSDQIPVWLKPDSGSTLMPRKVIQAVHKARKGRKSRIDLVKAVQEGREEEQNPEAEQQDRNLATAAGNPANSRCRYTLVARQLIFDFFKPGFEPRGDQDWISSPTAVRVFSFLQLVDQKNTHTHTHTHTHTD